MENTKKIYTLRNYETKAEVTCTEKYLLEWLARGFKVVSIKVECNLDKSPGRK